MTTHTSTQIVEAVKDVELIVAGGTSRKAGRERMIARFAGMRDRTAAANMACAILDEAKATGKVGVTVTGKKQVTTVVNGVSTTKEMDVRNDTTSNAKSALASCVNGAYPDYNDRLTLVSHKANATTCKWSTKKQTDKVQDTIDKLADLLELTGPEKADVERMAMNAIHEQAIKHNEYVDSQIAARKAEAEAEAERKEQAAQAHYAAIEAQVTTIAEKQGIKATEKAKLAIIRESVTACFAANA